MTAPGRPIGARIRQMLEILEQAGPLPYRDIAAWMPGVHHTNVNKYCHRAEAMGLVTKHAKLFEAMPNWRDLMKIKPLRATPKRKGKKYDSLALQQAWGAA